MKKNYFYTTLIFFFIFLHKNIQAENIGQDSSKIFRINFSNDFLVQTDHYYTNGLNLLYSDLRLGNSFFYNVLFPYGNNQTLNSYSISINQDIYTPLDISANQKIKDRRDRPYASTLTLGLQKSIFWESKKIKLHSEFKIGIMGEYALGKEVQNGFHELLTESDPAIGWDEQLKSDILINYNLTLEKGILNKKNIEINALARTALGTEKTNLGIGLNNRIGLFRGYFEGNTQYNYKQKQRSYNKNWQLFFSYKPTINYILYDATLQGGMILNKKSRYPLEYSDLENIVLKQDFSITTTYKDILLRIGVISQSKEFKEGNSHKWGYINLAFRF